MSISRLHTWSAGEILLASDLNSEFNNIINNGTDLVSPFSKALSMGGFTMYYDASNSIGLTSTTNGLTLTGGAFNLSQGADVASASTVNLDTATGNTVDVTGTVTWTAVTLSQGRWRLVRHTGAQLLTNGASLVLIGGANITTASGDYSLFVGYSGGVVRQALFFRAASLTATLAGTEALTNKSVNGITIAGTNATTMTFPTTSATIARTDAANTFTGHQTIEGVTSTGATGTGKLVFDASPTLSGTPLSPTAAVSTNTTQIASTAFVSAFAQPISNVLGGDVTVVTAGTYYDGPVVAQGSSGTWFATGNVTVVNTAGAAFINAKLWDGTTVIASARTETIGANSQITISLCGYLASPAGNIRISITDPTNNGSSKMVFNASGNSKDCEITAFKVAN